MFHELWVGISKISPLTHKVTGFFQRKIVDSIVHATTPKLITTTNRLYQSLLSARSIDSSILPLFSNIRVAPRDDLFVSKVYKELTINESEIDQYLITGIFGELHSGAKIQKALTELLRCYKDENRKIVFIGFGKISAKGLNEFRRLENHLSDKIKFLHLGIQTEGHISNLLQLLDTAFSCTPSLHIGKSGVFAAMKLHGVRIVLPEEDTIPEYRLEIRKFNEEYMNRPSCNWNVSNIANHFSTLLSAIDD